MQRDTLMRLTDLVEVKDQCTAAHTWRVVLYIQALAEAMDVDVPIVQRMMRGAAVHDVGKIDIPAQILTKPGTLTEDEYRIIQRHAELGFDRLVAMNEDDAIVLAIVRSHHERLDGSGYPDHLRGESIPQPARLFAVVDAFDAMTSVRPYRPTVPATATSRARKELRDHREAWYCPRAVDVFIDLLDNGRLSWIQRHFNDTRACGSITSPPSIDAMSEYARTVRGRASQPADESVSADHG